MKDCQRFASLVLFFSLLATSAAAEFETGSLVQVVYKNDEKEVATDLADMTAFDLSQKGRAITEVGTFELAQFLTAETWDDLEVGFFSYDGAFVYFATTEDSAPEENPLSWGSFLGAADGVYQYYNTLVAPGERTVEGLPSNFNSYWVKMDSGTTPGQYAGFNLGYPDGKNHGEANLGPLGDTGYVDMYLYKYRKVGRDVYLVPGTGNDFIAVLRVRENGSSVLNPCMDPIDCDDGLWCNGVESCEAGVCAPGLPVDCDDASDCTADSCDEGLDMCVQTCTAGGRADPCCQHPACSGEAVCKAPLNFLPLLLE